MHIPRGLSADLTLKRLPTVNLPSGAPQKPLPNAQTTLMDIGTIHFELKNLLGLEVDVLTPNGLPANFREQVLREAVAI